MCTHGTTAVDEQPPPVGTEPTCGSVTVATLGGVAGSSIPARVDVLGPDGPSRVRALDSPADRFVLLAGYQGSHAVWFLLRKKKKKGGEEEGRFIAFIVIRAAHYSV